ncbi:hypothetical protein [Ornithinimicrobium murale]|uniref:hypothetical protein n=1 Tax=Ornithinimicrobium murale TaxID=1050153 RepID=UPI0013B38156|nr:hypothetical protein [Ornithinimicrobium murale]
MVAEPIRHVLAQDLAPPVRLDQVASRAGLPMSLRAHTRDDPYYSSLFTLSSRAAWTGRDLILREMAAGADLAVPWQFRKSVEVLRSPDDDPIGDILATHRQDAIRMLSAVNMWRTMTVPQMAAMVGAARWAKSGWPTPVARAHGGGLLQAGVLTSLVRADLPTLLRVDPDGDPGPLLDRLTFAEWLGLTSGQLWRGSNTPDRHNIMVVEMALRIAQMCPGAGVVLGEMCGNHDLLLGVESKRLSRRRADSVVIRKDGLKIALEATASDRFAGKMENWVDFLVADKSKSTVVVFVEMVRPGYSSEATYQAIFRGMAKAVSSSMSAVAAGVLERMFLVRWSDWFPAAGVVTPDFATLPATRYAGDGIGSHASWARVDLLDPASLPFSAGATPRDPMTALSNARLLTGAPKVLTDKISAPMPDVGAALRATAGFPTIPGV